MLEKIGLPAKPSLRGNNWVVDASHCQGCSSQFTFINRKHHCRRCGGIFCGTCTQQRMVLRGQGDSPVRICDPCKKLEEAARFELRHGHRGRAGKGSSARTTDSSNEDDILASDVKGSSSSRTASITTASSTGKPSRMGSSNSPADLYVDETRGSSSMDETVSATPEDLRHQAMDEKKKYKILKGEGKNEEALKAFKRGKELERQAHALEMDLRKSRKKVSSSGGDNKGQNIVTAEGSQRLRNQVPKDDLMSELKLMGWSDKDLENEGKKSKNVSVEGELLALIGEVSNKKKPDENYSGAKAEIAAHKRKAILLKKEGKIGEAKEELKKAKILERQAEEEELLGGAEDSDDEFADLIRSMDSQKEDLNGMSSMQDFDMGLILPDIDNLGEGNFEVTEDDMEDPELAGALQSLGWTEEPKVVVGSKSSGGVIPQENEASYNGAAARVSDLKRESYLPSARRKTKAELQRELLGLKRKAFGLRREGKADEAEEVQKMAKALEDQIAELDVLKKMPVERIDVVENSEEIDDTEVTENDLQDPALLGMLNDLGWEDHGGRPSSQTVVTVSSSKVAAPRSKAIVQREVLGLKRKALELRRKGEMAEAEEVSNKAKVLQAELEELDAPKEDIPPNNNGTADNKSGGITESSPVKKAPTEEDGSVVIKGGMATENADLVIKAVGVNSAAEVVHRSPVKQEISDHKKRALALKREGKLAEAKEELIKAKLLERSLDEGVGDNNPEPTVSLSSSSATTSTSVLQEKERDHPDASLPTPQPSSSSSPSISMPSMPAHPSKPLSSRERFKIQQESLSHKRQAMKLRREGKMQEAEAEFELAKALEAQLEEHDSSTQSNSEDVDDVMVEDFLDPQLLSALKLIGIGGGNDNGASTSTEKPAAAAAAAGKVVSSAGGSTEERVQLEEEIKAEKVKALRLKRAGKQKDALEALKRAKLLERKLSEFH